MLSVSLRNIMHNTMTASVAPSLCTSCATRCPSAVVRPSQPARHHRAARISSTTCQCSDQQHADVSATHRRQALAFLAIVPGGLPQGSVMSMLTPPALSHLGRPVVPAMPLRFGRRARLCGARQRRWRGGHLRDRVQGRAQRPELLRRTRRHRPIACGWLSHQASRLMCIPTPRPKCADER